MSLDPDCLAQLKLRQQPFDEVPDEDFLYSDPLLESLIETASRALNAPGAIVILAGALGSGRSVQLMRLLGALDEGLELIAFRGRSGIPFEAIDATIRSHLDAGGFDDPGRALPALLAERARAGAALVLAIDDAHSIGSESIERLLRIRAEILESGGQGLRLVLVGDQSFSRGSLPLPDPLDESLVVRLNLRPFNLEQAGAYLRHRLRVAGIEDPDGLLTSGDIAVLQTNSKGLPDALNKNANAWLLRRCRSTGVVAKPVSGALSGLGQGARSSKSRFDEPPDDDLRAAVDSGTDLPEGLLDLDAEEETYRRSSSAPAVAPVPADPELSRFLVGEDARPDAQDFEQILRHVRQHQASQSPPRGKEPAAVPATAASKVPYWNRRWFLPAIVTAVLASIGIPVALQLMGRDRPPARAPEPAVQAPPVQAPTAQETPSGAAPAPSGPGAASEPAEEGAPQSEAPAAEPEPAAESEQEKAPEEASPAQAPAVEPSAPSERPPPEAPPEAAPASNAASSMQEDLDWLMRQDGGRFTIQLVAAQEAGTAREFLEPHGLSGVHYVQTRTYVIGLVGSFPNRATAAAMLDDFPAAVRQNGPWIRTIGSIRDSLP